MKAWISNQTIGIFLSRRGSIACAVCIVLTHGAWGHDGPTAVISQLNREMLKSGPSADLLFRRAAEFRALRDYPQAASDLNRAVRLDSSMTAARLELAKLQLQLEKQASAEGRSSSFAGEPLETIAPLCDSSDPALRAAALAIRGEILMSYQRWTEAARDFSEALVGQADVQWILWCAESQQKSGQPEAALRGLRQALDVTASPVICSALCDQLLERTKTTTDAELREACGQEAALLIRSELETCRLCAAWWVRAAELDLVFGRIPSADAYLKLALRELEGRLQTDRPDPALVVLQNRAQELLIRIEQH
jgi:tetratricopeptide (TPR) repeat protein